MHRPAHDRTAGCGRDRALLRADRRGRGPGHAPAGRRTKACPPPRPRCRSWSASGSSSRSRARPPAGSLRARIRAGQIGGVILFGSNIASPSQLKALTAKLQLAAHNGGQPPLLITTDQEGGLVKRIPWAPPEPLGTAAGPAADRAVPHRRITDRRRRCVRTASTSTWRRSRTCPPGRPTSSSGSSGRSRPAASSSPRMRRRSRTGSRATRCGRR